jgi:hypothetical protein
VARESRRVPEDRPLEEGLSVRAPSRQTEIRARFKIIDLDRDPDAVTERLGVRPDEVWRAGDPVAVPGKGKKYANAGWMIQSRLGPTETAPRHVADLLERMGPGWAALKGLDCRHHVELSLTVVMHGGDEPELGFDAETVERLAQVRAHIDVDLYNQ